MNPAILPGTEAGPAFEEVIQVFHVTQSAPLGHFLHRQRRFGDQFNRPLPLDLPDERMRRLAQLEPEHPFEHGAGHSDMLEHTLDGQSFAGVLLDVAEGTGQFRLIHGIRVAGPSGHNADGRNFQVVGVDFPSTHHFVQQGGGIEADLAGIRNDRRQRRITEAAEDPVIVHSDHGHLLGNVQFRPATRLQNLLSAVIVAGHDADWPIALPEPLGEPLFLSVPGKRLGSGPFRFVDNARQLLGGQTVAKAGETAG